MVRKDELSQVFKASRDSSTAFANSFSARLLIAASSIDPVIPSGLKRPIRAFQRHQASWSIYFDWRPRQRSQAGSSGQFERPSGADRARAAISRIVPKWVRAVNSDTSAKPSELEQPISRTPEQRGLERPTWSITFEKVTLSPLDPR